MHGEASRDGTASERAGDDVFVLMQTNQSLSAQIAKLRSEVAALQREKSDMGDELTKHRVNARLKRRLDLEGRRISRGPGHEVFLIIQGVRHLICSDKVYNMLFDSKDVMEGVTTVDDLTEIEAGAPLEEGTCLVRSKKTGVIHLLANMGQATKLHAIANYDTFRQMGFSERHALVVPDLLLDRCPRGWPLDMRASA